MFSILLRALGVLVLATLTSPFSHAQISNLTNQTSTPIPGAGHDYIHLLSETVNPSNGTVSVRISPPMPKGRGLTIPFSFSYDSGSAIHLDMASPGGAVWSTNSGYLSQGGWSYGVPVANETSWFYNGSASGGSILYNCYYSTGFMFKDPKGGLHDLHVAVGDSEQSGAGSGGTYNGCSPYNASYTPSVNSNNVETWLGKTGGDAQTQGTLSCPPRPTMCANPTLTVSDADGTVYAFGVFSQNIETGTGAAGSQVGYSLASSIEDRNGNVIALTSQSLSGGAFTYTDTLGRPIISSSGFGSAGSTNTVTLAGLTYQVTWRQTQSAYSVATNQVNSVNGINGISVACNVPQTISAPQTVIDHITLPNGQTYQFYYGDENPLGVTNPYGLLSEIVYPDGGWVKYTWGLPSNAQQPLLMTEFIDFDGYTPNSTSSSYPDGCQFQYQAPVLLSRTVGYTNSTTPALTQTFAYQVNWNPNAGTFSPPNSNWTTKVTTVTDNDPFYGSKQTVYTYSSVFQGGQAFSDSTLLAQIPVEQTVQFYDWGNSSTPLKTTTKAWVDQYTLASEQTALPNLQPSLISYCYTGQSCLSGTMPGSGTSITQLQEQDDFDYGASSATRRNVNTYQVFPGTLGTIVDKPCKSIIYDASGQVAETDNYFDGGTTLCVEPSSPGGVLAVSNLPAGYTHDESNFGPTSNIPRGNLTKQVSVAGVGTSPTRTYAYDETGQVRSMTDPCGNASCSDMTGTSHTTTYSYNDNPSGGNASGNSNAYLTQVIYPSTNGISQQVGYSYNYLTGNLVGAIDENNQSTGYIYNDSLNRIKEIDYPDGGKTLISYNDAIPSITTSELISTSPSTLWKTSVRVMDGLGHITQTQRNISDPLVTDYVETTYDGESNVHSVSNPHRSVSQTTDGVTSFKYDGLGRKTLQTNQDGSTEQQWQYGGGTITNGGGIQTTGEMTTFTDEVGNASVEMSDALGRLILVKEPTTALTYYHYDALNNLLHAHQGGLSGERSRDRYFTYDSLSRLIDACNPEVLAPGLLCDNATNWSAVYAYDASGNVQKKTDARGVVITYSYDALNRLLGKSYAGTNTLSTSIAAATPSTCYQYDTNPSGGGTNFLGRLTFEWTQFGNCPSSLPSSGSGYQTLRTVLSYDSMGRILQEQQCNLGTCTNQLPYTAGQSYDLVGNETTYTNGLQNLTFFKSYDANGRPQRVQGSQTDLSHAVPLLSIEGYAPPGEIQNMTLGTGTVVTKSYDSRLRPTTENAIHP